MKKEVPLAGKRKKSLGAQMWERRYLFLLLLPALVWVILICYAPMTGLYMAFINYTPTSFSESFRGETPDRVFSAFANQQCEAGSHCQKPEMCIRDRLKGEVDKNPQTAAIILAGGTGERFGKEGGKQLVEIAGKPIPVSYTHLGHGSVS